MILWWVNSFPLFLLWFSPSKFIPEFYIKLSCIVPLLVLSKVTLCFQTNCSKKVVQFKVLIWKVPEHISSCVWLNTCSTWWRYQLVNQQLVQVLKDIPGYQIQPTGTCHYKILLFCHIPELFCRSPWPILTRVPSLLFVSVVSGIIKIQAIRLH